jgi:hypothetical protein
MRRKFSFVAIASIRARPPFKVSRHHCIGLNECFDRGLKQLRYCDKTTPEWDKTAREFTGGRGVDQVLEVGGVTTLTHSFNAIA